MGIQPDHPDGAAEGRAVIAARQPYLGMAIQKELGIPIKFVGLGEKADDLQPFDPQQFARALFEE